MGLGVIASLLGSIAPTIAQALLGGGTWGEKAMAAVTGVLGGTADMSIEDMYMKLQGMGEDERVTMARLDEQFKALLINAQLELGRATIVENVAEETSSDVLQKDWRPVLAWVCDGAVAAYFAVGFLIMPVLALATLVGLDPAKVQTVKACMPVFDITNLMVLLGYLLGYGGLQALTNSSSTVEKAEQVVEKAVAPVKKHWYSFMQRHQ